MSMVDPLAPWAERPEHDAPFERRVSRLFAAVPDPSPLPERARQRVGYGLRSRSARGVRVMVVKLIALGAVIGMAGAAAAQWASTRFFSAQSTFVMAPRVSVASPPLVPQPSLPRPVVALPEPPSLAEPALPAPAPLGLPAPAQSSPLGLEAASLEAALSELRGGGAQRGARALTALDRHLRVFAGGALELEARVARVDALLVLGRRQDARRELSALPIEHVGRKSELRLIRAELRSDEDCRLALQDFQVLVEQPLPSAWAERALFGRGACLLKLGDAAGAERDFARYLERFPSGRFAEQIRAQK